MITLSPYDIHMDVLDKVGDYCDAFGMKQCVLEPNKLGLYNYENSWDILYFSDAKYCELQLVEYIEALFGNSHQYMRNVRPGLHKYTMQKIRTILNLGTE